MPSHDNARRAISTALELLSDTSHEAATEELRYALRELDPGEDPRPTALLDSDRANFHTFMEAAANDDVAILHARHRATGHHHALLCVLSAVPGSEDTDMIPFARLIDGDVTEQYDDPTEDEPVLDRTELLARLPEWVDVPADATDEDLRAMLREVDADDPPLYTDPED